MKWSGLMKKKIVVCCGIILFGIIAFFIYTRTLGAPVVGTITGPEWEYLTIGENRYEITHEPFVGGIDKGSFIGIATNGETKFRIYSITGSDEYVYCQWEWEGEIYKRIQ